MSNLIVAQLEDPRINDIRSAVHQKTDAVPFLLLPVRIETKFMQVTLQPEVKKVTVETVLEGMAFFHVQVLNVQLSISGPNIRALAKAAGDLTNGLKQLGGVSVQEKGWFKQLYNDIELDLKIVIAKAGAGFILDIQQLNAATAGLKAAITALPTRYNPLLPGVTDIITRFSKVESALKSINSGTNKVPYRNIKNKKDLYRYVTRTLDDALAFYQEIGKEISAVSTIKANQRTRLQQLHEAIRTQISKTAANVAAIHKDAAWQKFVDNTVAPKIKAALESSQQFGTRVLPGLNRLPAPPKLQTGEIFFHGVQTLVKIRKFNLQEIKQYQVMSKYKKYLAPRIQTMANAVSAPIPESAAGGVAAVKSLYAAISKEATASLQRIQGYAARNTSQTYGKNIITNFVDKEAIQVIGAYAAGTERAPFPKAVFEPKPPQIVKQLWVRVYPDDIFVKTHEEKLTQTELDAGRQFWKVWWAASNDSDLEMAAWRTLCTALGTKRASWVARLLNPITSNVPQNNTALQQKPSEKITDALQLLEGVYVQFKKIPPGKTAADTYKFLQTSAVLQTVNNTLPQVITALTGIATAQDYLLEKLTASFIRSADAVNQLALQAQQLTPAQVTQFQSVLQAFTATTQFFGNLQTLLSNITPADHKKFVDTLADPFVYPAVQLKDKDWTAAPATDVLPDRFVVVTEKNGVFRHIQVGNPINQNLQLGLDPQKFNNGAIYSIDAGGNMVIDEKLKWMTDYPEAVKNGMGITLDLSDAQYNEGFDRLIVLGVKNTDAANSRVLLEKLITNHIYSADGMTFLKTGTPTNNTHERKAGFGLDDDLEERYNIEIKNIKYDAAQTNNLLKADGRFFCDALGLDNKVLQYANNGDNLEIANALAMNRSLWGATLGHYMEEMWDKLFTYDNIRRTEKFFTSYCSGRGIVPAIRVGAQPYGILATTAFSRLVLHNGLASVTQSEMATVKPWDPVPPLLDNRLQQRFEYRLHELLKMLNNVWTGIRNQKVLHAGNLHDTGDAQQRFVEMLGLHATSLEYCYRYSVNIARGANANENGFSTNFKADDAFGPNGLMSFFKDQVLPGKFAPSFDFLDENLAYTQGWPSWMKEDAAYSRIREQFDKARLYDARLIENSYPVAGSIIDKVPLSFENTLSLLEDGTNYLDWLLAKDPGAILGANDINGEDSSMPANNLLFLMLRQSLMQGYQEAALNLMQKEGMLLETVRRETGSTERYHYKVFDTNGFKNQYLTKWHYLYKHFEDLKNMRALPDTITGNPFYNFIAGGPDSMANYLDRVKNVSPAMYNISHQPFFKKLKDIRDAVQHLKRVPTGGLEILLAEHLDLCSYRLDAWLLGLVHQRLQKQRSQQPAGIFLGAYGYVENLRRDTGKTVYNQPAKLANFKLETGKPVLHDAGNDGFIHCPSIAQSITAAVLRNAYRTNVTDEDITNRLAVNISSARVRTALQLVEGINNGQEMGALLGFLFERGLHERYHTVELDKFIQPFRQAFPLQQKVEETANGSPAYVSLVVNGSDMLDLVHEAIEWINTSSNTSLDKTVADLLKENNYALLPAKIKTVIDGALVPADNKNKVYNAIIEEIDRMADAFDALGDLAISESVYQMVNGNHVRAGAVMTALAEGRSIPEMQVIDTNRNGTIVTHKMLLHFNGVNGGNLPAGWTGVNSVRYLAEPSFNKWLGQTLGPAANIKYVLTVTDTLSQVTKVSLSLDTLGWQPVDLFALPGGENELRETLISLYRKNNNIFDAAISLDLKERDASWTAADRSLSGILLLLKHIRNMIGNARYAGAGELMMPNDVTNAQNPGNHNVAELETRMNAARNSLQLFITQVAAAPYVAPVLDGTVAVADVELDAAAFNGVFSFLQNALMLGFPGVLSGLFQVQDTPGQRNTACLQRLINVYKEAQARSKSAAAAAAKLASLTEARQKVEKLGELGRITLGKTFLAIPQFTPPSMASITQQLALPIAQKITRNGGVMAVDDWMQQVAKVRKRVYDLQSFQQLADAFDLPFASVQPVQLPYAPGDYWLGLEYPSNFDPGGDKLSLVLLNEAVLQAPGPVAGLLLDEWLEVIPATDVTTGITFNYNQPNASAPQSILLAVTPGITNQWEWDDLVHTIIDTVELAKNRAVEPDHIDKSFLNHALPAIAAEVAPPQVKEEDDNPLGVQLVMDFADIIKPKKN